MYGYVRNSPMTLVDPSGLDETDCTDDASCDDPCDYDPSSCEGGIAGGGGSGGPGQTPPGGITPFQGTQQAPGAGNPGTYQPVDIQALILLGQRNFSSRCNAAFTQEIPQYTNASFFNSLKKAPIEQYPPYQQMPPHVGGTIAQTLPGQQGQPIQLLWDFYVRNRIDQAFTLIHENIHRVTGWRDPKVFTTFDKYGVQQNNGISTDKITIWLKGGCVAIP
jgi:hypothetical protein